MQTFTEIDHSLLQLFNGGSSLFLDNLAVTLTNGLTWIPLYLVLFYIVVKNNETMKQIMLVVACVCICMILADGVTDYIVKPAVGRLRPLNDELVRCSLHIVDGQYDNSFSFFSAHAANTCCVAMFFSLLIRNRQLGMALFGWSAVNCWTRLYLGFHYPSDVLVGLLWGAAVGFVVYMAYLKLYLKLYPNYNYVSSQYTSTGYNHADVDVVLVVLLATVLCAVMRALWVFV